MNNLVLRRYVASDNKQLRELYELSSINSEIGYRKGPWESDFADMENYYFNGGEFLVGLIGDKMVVMGGFRKIVEGIGQIRRMRTHPDFRRKGFAQQLIIKLEDEAKKSKIEELRLKTSKQQIMAQKFYEKNGFKKMETKKEFYEEGGANSFEVIWYSKLLK